jgi:Adenylate and Guanylate cyclase catalytic domain
MVDSNAGTAEDKRITFRIGVNLGDVIADGDDIYGDGVNIAARLEALAEPGGICVSRVVRDQVRDKLDFAFEDMGEQKLKNIARPLRVCRLCADRVAVGLIDAVQPSLPLPDKPSIAVLPFQNLSGDPEQEYFADGMVEEIITALSRIRWLFVIASNSSFTYKAQSLDVKQVGSGARRAILTRRLGAQGWPTPARCRGADRRNDWRSSLGRPVRRLARRHLRPSGSR